MAGTDDETPELAARRARVADVLREAMASGHLTLGDYQSRLKRLRAAVGADELDAVLCDIPVPRRDEDRERPAASGGASAPAAPEPGIAAPARPSLVSRFVHGWRRLTRRPLT